MTAQPAMAWSALAADDRPLRPHADHVGGDAARRPRDLPDRGPPGLATGQPDRDSHPVAGRRDHRGGTHGRGTHRVLDMQHRGPLRTGGAIPRGHRERRQPHGRSQRSPAPAGGACRSRPLPARESDRSSRSSSWLASPRNASPSRTSSRRRRVSGGIRALRVERRGTTILAKWHVVPEASGYEMVLTTDGSSGSERLRVRGTAVTLRGVAGWTAGRVSVRAVDTLREGLIASAPFKATASPRTRFGRVPKAPPLR